MGQITHEIEKDRSIVLERRTPFMAPKSRAMLAAIELIERYAQIPSYPVLLEGESGTGKTHYARYLHQKSPRKAAPFQRVSLASLTESLVGSDFFGHMKGSFTGSTGDRLGHFRTADGGTLFLDEIGSASYGMQGMLLTVVEDGEFMSVGADRSTKVDVRVIAATNEPLENLVRAGRFREDLMFRLRGLRVVIPPLRERREDIPGIVAWHIAKHAEDTGYHAALPVVEPGLMSRIQHSELPGNIRDIDSLVLRLMLAAKGSRVITEKHCTRDDAYLSVPRSWKRKKAPTADQVREALSFTGGKKGYAAKKLGCARTTLNRVLERDLAESDLG